MSDLISRQAAIDAIGKKSDEIYKTKQKGATYPHDDFFQGMAYAGNVVEQMPSAQPEPAIPLQWIEAQIEWLKSLDNAFSTLTAGQISAMVNKWEDEQDG